MSDVNLYNLEAEANVMGFFFNAHVNEDKRMQILQLVQPEHFSHGKNMAIYSGLKRFQIFDRIVLWDKIKTLDIIKRESVEWKDVEYIDDFVDINKIDSYVEILFDRYQKRKLYDFAEEIKKAMIYGENQYEIALKAQSILSHLSERSRLETNQELLEKVFNEDASDIISTGFKHIDEFIGGLTRGMVVVIGGDSGHMKTTLALEQSFRMADKNPTAKIGIFSKEMTSESLIKKQISRICGIPINKIFSQQYDKEEVKRRMMEVPAWRDNRIKIVNPNLFTGVADIARIQMAQRFDVWFLDFIQLLEFAKGAASSSDFNIQVGQNMRNLQSLALATKSVGIILSQVKKGIEYRESKKPTISDLEWSGLIKQLASYIFFSYYPCKYYGQGKISDDRYYLLGEKTRFSETFTYPMIVNPQLGIFTEVDSPSERTNYVNELNKLLKQRI